MCSNYLFHYASNNFQGTWEDWLVFETCVLFAATERKFTLLKVTFMLLEVKLCQHGDWPITMFSTRTIEALAIVQGIGPVSLVAYQALWFSIFTQLEEIALTVTNCIERASSIDMSSNPADKLCYRKDLEIQVESIAFPEGDIWLS